MDAEVIERMEFKRGDTLSFDFEFTEDSMPVDLSGCSASLQLRLWSDGPAVATASSLDGGITIDGTAGVVSVVIDPDQTRGFEPNDYSADLEVTWPSGHVTSTDTFIIGIVGDVTRPA